MVEILSSYGSICGIYDGSRFGKSSVRKQERVRPSFCFLNLRHSKLSCLQNNCIVEHSPVLLVVAQSGRLCELKPLVMSRTTKISFSIRRDHVVSACYCKSGVACRQQISMLTWDQEVRFSTNEYIQKQLPLGSPVIQQELGVEITHDLSCSKLERQFQLSEGKLLFLEEQDEELLSKRVLILSRLNKVKSALEIFTSMTASGLRPNAHACNSLLSSLVRNGSHDDALKVFEIMNEKGMATGHTFSLVLKAVASAQGCNSALEMFKALEEAGISKTFDVIVYNTMISICGKARNWIETERTWRKLRQNALRSTMITYELLVSIFVQCGQPEFAVDAYYDMIQSGLEPSEDILKAVLSSCTKEGKWDLGLNIFQKMLDHGIKPNMIAFNSMINCLGKAGKDDLAFKVYYLLKSVGHRPDGYTWSALLCALYRSNRYADAIQLFEGIKTKQDVDLNAHLYNMALMSCQRLGLWERSLQLLWQMEKSGIQMSTTSYNHVISACEVAREPKVALQVYRHMIQQKCAPDTFTYLSLIRSCIWGSLWTEIEEIMEVVAPNSSLYNALIHGLCLRGKIEVAKIMYKKMRSIGLKPDGKTRALMLQHLPCDSRRR
ncbi:pentatricopeptide repeat-containing protein At3g29290 [Musa acuminata AAA Group]|uniref:pentatricopeptide repeat-containing protein At3g29290 n=1 Tax=Musa acuminata AAA Group TaxID=214697 RepID=UPI0031E2DA48